MPNYANPPANIADFMRRIDLLSKETGILQREIVDIISRSSVSAMLPQNSAIKGGGAIGLIYPLEDTRLTKDLDTVFSGELEGFIQVFSDNLETGWNNFSGKLVPRGNKPKNSTMPGYFEMTPINVKLSYKGKPFSTVEMDVTPEINNEISLSRVSSTNSISKVFESLNIPRPDMIHILSVESQLAQKLQGLANPAYARGHDLIDIQLILRNEQQNINNEIFSQCLRKEWKIWEREYPLNPGVFESRLKANYEEFTKEYSYALPYEKAISDAFYLINEAMEQTLPPDFMEHLNTYRISPKSPAAISDSVSAADEFSEDFGGEQITRLHGSDGKRLRAIWEKLENKNHPAWLQLDEETRARESKVSNELIMKGLRNESN